ncbi:MAG: glycosyltransferase family 4 protein [Bacteroidales bacterium]|nr:glycosyltransferase family 4 protein [Bacteroidales bacterium]
MKILMLNYEYPPLGGGAGRICKNISEYLVQFGHEVTILTTHFGSLPEIEKVNGKPTIWRIKSKRKKQFQSNPYEMYDWLIKSWKELKVHLINNQYDLCFANFSIPGGWLAYKIRKKFGIPYCIISHGHDIPWFYKKQMFVYHVIMYFTIKKIVNNAHYLFVQSKYMRLNAEKFVGQKHHKKVVLIPNGVNRINIDTSLRQKNIFTILFVGRLVKQKNPLIFLKAMKRLSRMQIPYHAFMIGDGKLRNKLEKYIVKNKLKHVKITGWLDDENVWKFYEKSHVMVMPSEIEGMSISNLEALSAGLYLIATPVSGNSEMLACCCNGEIVPLHNDREISNAIQRFYFQQYLNKKFLADNNREQFIQVFSWEKIVKEYEKYLLLMTNRTVD